LVNVLSFKEYCNTATSTLSEFGVVTRTVICGNDKSGVKAKLLMFVLGGVGGVALPLYVIETGEDMVWPVMVDKLALLRLGKDGSDTVS
jgi:hypothetical protein